MSDFFKGLGAFLVIIFLLVGLGWVIEGNDFFLYRYFAPKQEAVRREVFEQSKAYNQGQIQELQNMEFAIIRTPDANSKRALAAIMLHRAADYDRDKLPADLRSFLDSLQRNLDR